MDVATLESQEDSQRKPERDVQTMQLVYARTLATRDIRAYIELAETEVSPR